jgi:hypothetical protein
MIASMMAQRRHRQLMEAVAVQSFGDERLPRSTCRLQGDTWV